MWHRSALLSGAIIHTYVLSSHERVKQKAEGLDFINPQRPKSPAQSLLCGRGLEYQCSWVSHWDVWLHPRAMVPFHGRGARWGWIWGSRSPQVHPVLPWGLSWQRPSHLSIRPFQIYSPPAFEKYLNDIYHYFQRIQKQRKVVKEGGRKRGRRGRQQWRRRWGERKIQQQMSWLANPIPGYVDGHCTFLSIFPYFGHFF